jgi:esterase/lipase superfamily enzyme
MRTSQHTHYSHALGREMTFRIYGHGGRPMVVFPAQDGHYQEYEGFGMITACQPWLERGQLQILALDGLDGECWTHPTRHPSEKAAWYNAYERYVLHEALPTFQALTGNLQAPIATGCSMGGYHSANFYFRHPSLFSGLIALSGVYTLQLFVGDYMDEAVYYHTPLAYLSGLQDPHYLNAYRQGQIVLCVGQGAWEEPMLTETRQMQHLLHPLGVPAWVDVWGHDVAHDWPWWRQQMPYFLGHLL